MNLKNLLLFLSVLVLAILGLQSQAKTQQTKESTLTTKELGPKPLLARGDDYDDEEDSEDSDDYGDEDSDDGEYESKGRDSSDKDSEEDEDEDEDDDRDRGRGGRDLKRENKRLKKEVHHQKARAAGIRKAKTYKSKACTACPASLYKSKHCKKGGRVIGEEPCGFLGCRAKCLVEEK